MKLRLILGVIFLLLVFYIDIFTIEAGWLEGRFPVLHTFLLFKSVIAATASFFIISAIKLAGEKCDSYSEYGDCKFDISFVSVTLLISLFFVILFFFYPPTFSYYAQEDRAVEYLSAIFCFLAFIILLLAARKLYSNKSGYSLKFWGVLFLGSLVFLIGLEEVSWFQRILGFNSNILWEGNAQNEFNLHNYITELSENIYYFSAFILFVLLPFINLKLKIFKQNDTVSFFVPNIYLIFAGAVIASYNFDMWDVSFTQLALFGSFFVLINLDYARMSFPARMITDLTLITLVLNQTLFLAFGRGKFHWINDVKEYKEFFIALALLFYSFGIYRKTVSSTKSRAT